MMTMLMFNPYNDDVLLCTMMIMIRTCILKLLLHMVMMMMVIDFDVGVDVDA